MYCECTCIHIDTVLYCLAESTKLDYCICDKNGILWFVSSFYIKCNKIINSFIDCKSMCEVNYDHSCLNVYLAIQI